MGEHSVGTLYLDGKPVEDMPEFSICDGNRNAPVITGFIFPCDVHVTTRPATTCKTRKRFVKLLMGRGYSRNRANRLAEETKRRGCSYQALFFGLFPLAQIFKTRMVSGNAERQ